MIIILFLYIVCAAKMFVSCWSKINYFKPIFKIYCSWVNLPFGLFYIILNIILSNKKDTCVLWHAFHFRKCHFSDIL